jgi:hypothetical protein
MQLSESQLMRCGCAGSFLRQMPTRTPESKKPSRNDWAKCLNSLGWLMGLEPTTTGITILDSTN